MKNTSFLSFIVLILMIFSYACRHDPKDTTKLDPYVSCCGAEPVNYTSGDAYLYIPIVFTPNADGINDFFVPSYNEGITGLESYSIYSAVGDTLLYTSPGFDPNNSANTAWNGFRNDGTVYTGAFRYELMAKLKGGGLYKAEGTACRIVCGPDAAVFQTKTSCFYPSQVDQTGHLDPLIPSNEVDCFH